MQVLGNNELISLICEKINSSPHKAISFRDYMELCLYEPVHGYYSRNESKIGKEGDFYTSSSIGSIMGEMLAHFILGLHQSDAAQNDVLHIVEWGGGTGRLAKHILDEIRCQSPQIYAGMEYIVIEQSEYHRALQRETLAGHDKRTFFLTEEEWMQCARREGAIVLANELLDAFPVHRIRRLNHCMYEIYVAWDKHSQCFKEKLFEITEGPLLLALLEDKASLREGQTAEINLEAGRWIQKLSGRLQSGHIITIDYGDVAEEIYSSHRMHGTLMCYRKHQAYDDPYRHAGEQDITSHVNFSACIRAGREVGFVDWKLQTQRQFLVAAGILNKIADNPTADPFNETARRNRAIRQLLLSDQMSELFKVLVQTKKR